MSNSLRSVPDVSPVWAYPGLERKTFYACAFYIHRTRRTIGAPSLSTPFKTKQVTRHFLDRLADCFAWTKRPGETAEHVTATALLKNEQESRCTVLIAKNILHFPQEKDFADVFFSWLNLMSHTPDSPVQESHGVNTDADLWTFLVKSSEHRLVSYVALVREAAAGISKKYSSQDEWHLINDVIHQCNEYHLHDTSTQQLAKCSESASAARRDIYFGSLCISRGHRTELARKQMTLSDYFPSALPQKKPVDRLLDAIDFLARLRSSYEYFVQFRQAFQGTYFDHKIVTTGPVEWNGPAVRDKTASWADFVPGVEETGVSLDEAVTRYENRGSVHCEMQLLGYFVENDAPFPDYIGCSKKACALCQHVLVSCHIHVNGQHNFLYPRWSLPAIDFGERTHLIAAGLMSANTSMLSIIQQSVRLGKMPGRDFGIPHTSARHTRRHSFGQRDDGGSSSANTAVFSYTIDNQKSMGCVSAIHFPAGQGCKPRRVQMHLYKPNGKDRVEKYMASFDFGGKECVTAVQIRDKFVVGGTLHNIDEFRKCHWVSAFLLSLMIKRPSWSSEFKQSWDTLLRTSEELEENSCLQDILTENQQRWERQGLRDEDLLARSSPFRGEVFMLPSVIYGNGEGRTLDHRYFNLEESLGTLLVYKKGEADKDSLESVKDVWEDMGFGDDSDEDDSDEDDSDEDDEDEDDEDDSWEDTDESD